ncbi:hypothetical protein FNV43_RR10299 [Rhamnella rubrinervis]|uniref:Uncharacterized protein n=1 Tax=Rhamnella rubrinervis TaxID=2594499 RepID=A0A8K0ML71_9ROSA|nr:hypothetical protein FNV43_RR10299 [Rhamnella rubrinervis]
MVVRDDGSNKTWADNDKDRARDPDQTEATIDIIEIAIEIKRREGNVEDISYALPLWKRLTLNKREKGRDKERTERWGQRGTETRIGKGIETETMIDTTKIALEIEVSERNVGEIGMMTMMIITASELRELAAKCGKFVIKLHGVIWVSALHADVAVLWIGWHLVDF